MEPTETPGAEGLKPAPVASPQHAEDADAARRRRRRRGGHEDKIPGEEITHLNLTPMMDIMTILLVFLVQSFATDPGNINVNLSLHPPASTTKMLMEAATKVTVTAEQILVNDKVVMSVASFPTTVDADGLIAPVRDALDLEKNRIDQVAAAGGPPFDGKLVLVAHETTPYELLNAVLHSAGQAHFAKYELVVMKASEKNE